MKLKDVTKLRGMAKFLEKNKKIQKFLDMLQQGSAASRMKFKREKSEVLHQERGKKTRHKHWLGEADFPVGHQKGLHGQQERWNAFPFVGGL